jgi:hypothetical protein
MAHSRENFTFTLPSHVVPAITRPCNWNVHVVVKKHYQIMETLLIQMLLITHFDKKLTLKRLTVSVRDKAMKLRSKDQNILVSAPQHFDNTVCSFYIRLFLHVQVIRFSKQWNVCSYWDFKANFKIIQHLALSALVLLFITTVIAE